MDDAIGPPPETATGLRSISAVALGIDVAADHARTHGACREEAEPLAESDVEESSSCEVDVAHQCRELEPRLLHAPRCCRMNGKVGPILTEIELLHGSPE